MKSLESFSGLDVPVLRNAPRLAVAQKELERLHEGTIARYRLRPSEYEAWRKASESSSGGD